MHTPGLTPDKIAKTPKIVPLLSQPVTTVSPTGRLSRHWDPELYPNKLDREIERVKWARAQGFKEYKLLPLIQRMAAMATGREDNDNETKTR